MGGMGHFAFRARSGEGARVCDVGVECGMCLWGSMIWVGGLCMWAGLTAFGMGVLCFACVRLSSPIFAS